MTDPCLPLTRRDFLVLAAGAAVGSCGLVNGAAAGPGQTIDAGPASAFAKDGVYDGFSDSGFFVVRHGGSLFALSSVCTHRAVQLKAQPDCSFYCKRHGSKFSSVGQVTKGPARRNLPVFATTVNAAGHLLVSVPAA
jgi:Rieske Fe-S protein